MVGKREKSNDQLQKNSIFSTPLLKRLVSHVLIENLKI